MPSKPPCWCWFIEVPPASCRVPHLLNPTYPARCRGHVGAEVLGRGEVGGAGGGAGAGLLRLEELPQRTQRAQGRRCSHLCALCILCGNGNLMTRRSAASYRVVARRSRTTPATATRPPASDRLVGRSPSTNRENGMITNGVSATIGSTTPAFSFISAH